jgi:cell division protein FtsN
VLGDAVVLGDVSPRTMLSLALARTAMGQNREAVATLQAVQGSLPAADYGLALALAGDTAQGVNVLAEAVHSGQANEKLRQNLAYAYALDGHWAEARTVAAMDLPADKLDARLTQWAANAQPGAERARVAALLGAPVVTDAGLPAVLALKDGGAGEQLAVKAPVATPLPPPADKELPPVGGDSAPAAQPATGTMLASAEPRTPTFTPVQPQGVTTPAYAPTYTPVSKPVASPLRVAYAKPRVEKRVAAKPVKRKVEVARTEAPSTHLIQLGAFSTSANAERARKEFLAKRSELRSHDVTVTKAVVNGRDFWRVAASGFDSAAAHGACGRVKKAGGACFAYENGHLPAGQALALAAPVKGLPASAKLFCQRDGKGAGPLRIGAFPVSVDPHPALEQAEHAALHWLAVEGVLPAAAAILFDRRSRACRHR